VTAFKRAMNILKGSPSQRGMNPALLSEAAEKNLYQCFLKAKEEIERDLGKREYESALQEMIQMKKPIDDFFDGVMVMVEDEAIRTNRLALLDEIGKLFLRIADFSKLT
jgi:glycyl-tRNA synthetase beta chain